MSAAGIPLAEIFTASNSLHELRLIEDYALGGALAAIRYTEPFTTYDADIFYHSDGPGVELGDSGNLRSSAPAWPRDRGRAHRFAGLSCAMVRNHWTDRGGGAGSRASTGVYWMLFFYVIT